MDEKITLKLSKPIGVDSQTKHELHFKPVTGKHLRQGLPFLVTDSGGMKMDADAMANLIADCADIPGPFVDQMTAADFMKAAAIVASFFAEGGPTAS